MSYLINSNSWSFHSIFVWSFDDRPGHEKSAFRCGFAISFSAEVYLQAKSLSWPVPGQIHYIQDGTVLSESMSFNSSYFNMKMI